MPLLLGLTPRFPAAFLGAAFFPAFLGAALGFAAFLGVFSFFAGGKAVTSAFFGEADLGEAAVLFCLGLTTLSAFFSSTAGTGTTTSLGFGALTAAFFPALPPFGDLATAFWAGSLALRVGVAAFLGVFCCFVID